MVQIKEPLWVPGHNVGSVWAKKRLSLYDLWRHFSIKKWDVSAWPQKVHAMQISWLFSFPLLLDTRDVWVIYHFRTSHVFPLDSSLLPHSLPTSASHWLFIWRFLTFGCCISSSSSVVVIKWCIIHVIQGSVFKLVDFVQYCHHKYWFQGTHKHF